MKYTAMSNIGNTMHQLCAQLFPICRSITGNGVRQSLSILQNVLPELNIHEVESGTQCFDWVVPQEWNVKDAYIITPNGSKICDFKQNNLHLVGYSTPINKQLTLEQLTPHLYSLPEQPNAIPYVTSYYSKHWGFCLTEQQKQTLTPGNYQVFINSQLSNGHLTFADLLLPGESEQEILITSYICHPSMANNELSGPVVALHLFNWLKQLKHRKYSYRLVIAPETIGAIVYLSKHLKHLKSHVIAGFNLTCIGDDRNYSYLASRAENTLADIAALHALKHLHPEFKRYSFLQRGSDERQYCSPGVDLPMCSIMRTKYGEFEEYHTSLDDLSFVTPTGLAGGLNVMQHIIQCLELNETLTTQVLCEPQLGKRGLYPNISTKESGAQVQAMMDFISYCDGTLDTLCIAEKIGVPL